MRVKWRWWKKCPDCKAKGKPSAWLVPAHVNHWMWGTVPAYWRNCGTCAGKGYVRC